MHLRSHPCQNDAPGKQVCNAVAWGVLRARRDEYMITSITQGTGTPPAPAAPHLKSIPVDSVGLEGAARPCCGFGRPGPRGGGWHWLIIRSGGVYVWQSFFLRRSVVSVRWFMLRVSGRRRRCHPQII